MPKWSIQREEVVVNSEPIIDRCGLIFLLCLFCMLTTEGCAVIRLSIIIPAPLVATEFTALEETLVSVLENCPVHAEVIVACDETYTDPYDLADEVHLIRSAKNQAWTAHANRALELARGRFINILAPGVTVSDDWQRDACDFLARCSDTICAASPEVTYTQSTAHPSGGVILSSGGRRQFVDAADLESRDSRPMYSTIGACHQAGFFRRVVLLEAGGWNEAISPSIADVELNLRIRSLGYDITHCPESKVVGTSRGTSSSFRSTRELEQVYRAYRSQSFVKRRGLVGAIGSLFRGSLFGSIAGRFGRLPMKGIDVAPSEKADPASPVRRSRAA